MLRRQGWSFPPLKECRAKWEKAYPDWKWRDPSLDAWQAEPDDLADIEACRLDPHEDFQKALHQAATEARDAKGTKQALDAAAEQARQQKARKDQEAREQAEQEFIGPRRPSLRRRPGRAA